MHNNNKSKVNKIDTIKKVNNTNKKDYRNNGMSRKKIEIRKRIIILFLFLMLFLIGIFLYKKSFNDKDIKVNHNKLNSKRYLLSQNKKDTKGRKLNKVEIDKIIKDGEKKGLNITEKTLIIKGIKKERSFLFISDVHADVSKVMYHNAWGSRKEDRINLFTNQKGVRSYNQLKEWIKLCNKTRFDALLLGGDIIDFGDNSNIKFIRQNLKKLKIPYLYARGNHDGFNVLSKKRLQIRNTKELAKAFLNKDLNCGYIDYGDFIVCHINDALNYVPEVALNEFKKVYKKKKPIILVCHVPLCTENNTTLKKITKEIRGEERLIGPNLEFKMDNTTKKFYELVTKKDSNVWCVLAGHLHFHHEDKLTNRTYQYVNGCATFGEGYIIRVRGK